jgi:hypothetical protein
MNDFKNMKFNCKDMSQEERANLQIKLLNLGYRWLSGYVCKHLDKPFIFSHTNGEIYYCDDDNYFENNSFDEYNLLDGELVKVDDSVTQHTDDFGNTHTKTFEYSADAYTYTMTNIEDKMEYINLTYAEAWQALSDGKQVLFDDYECMFSKRGIHNGRYCSPIIVYKYSVEKESHECPFHPTDKLFKMKKEPEFQSLGLSDDCVEIEVFGLNLYQEKGHSHFYSVVDSAYTIPRDVHSEGKASVFRGDINRSLGKIKYKGDHDKAKIKVTVDKDGNITYEDVA